MKAQESKAKIAVSSCLLGNSVRFNGGHCKDKFITTQLNQFFDMISFCPEVEMGMSVPRPTLRLVETEQGERLICPQTGDDYTEQIIAYSAEKVKSLETHNLSGIVLKSASPSCGLFRVKKYTPLGHPNFRSNGFFARALKAHFPHLPIEEEGRLNDAGLRENFIYRVYSYQDWQVVKATNKIHELFQFHARHKYRLMAHNQNAVRKLGQHLASHTERSLADTTAYYEEVFFAEIATPPSRKNHANSLAHVMGYFSKKMTADERQALVKLIDDYRNDLLPLIVPMTRLRYYMDRFKDPYIEEQVYLYPHPAELKLLNVI